jgi:Leucine-rich repeat (LRR) protein
MLWYYVASFNWPTQAAEMSDCSKMKNGSLPECITELSKLQYLNISGSSKITEIPRSIGKLGCLEYLGL